MFGCEVPERPTVRGAQGSVHHLRSPRPRHRGRIRTGDRRHRDDPRNYADHHHHRNLHDL